MQTQLSILLLAIAVAGYRISAGLVGGEMAMQLANFTPLAALALFLGIYLKRGTALAVMMALQVGTSLVIAAVNKTPIHAVYIVVPLFIYATIAFAGPRLRRHFSWLNSLLGVVGATVVFHVVANTLSFYLDPSYAKTFTGWVQCQTFGVPGYPPTYLFLIKSLAGNVAFGLLFLLACGRPLSSAKAAVLTESDFDSAASATSV